MESDFLFDEIDRLILEAEKLLPEVTGRVKAAEERRKTDRSSTAQPHRLQVLIDAARKMSDLRNNPADPRINPLYLPEFRVTVEVMKKWKDNPVWRQLIPSFTESSNFRSAVSTLHVADRFESWGNTVRLVPTGALKTPDIEMLVKAEKFPDIWVEAECYAPDKFDGRIAELTHDDLSHIVEKTMRKAKEQIRNNIGMMVICGFNQSSSNIQMLKEALLHRLDSSTSGRQNLASIMVFVNNVLLRRLADRLEFTAIQMVDYVGNPSYFGRVTIEQPSGSLGPSFITEPLFEGDFKSLMEGKGRPVVVRPHLNPRRRDVRLVQVSGSESSAKPRLISKRHEFQILMTGAGNINFLCAKCSNRIAEGIWLGTLSGIVMQCSSCKSLNLFEETPRPNFPILGVIGVAPGNYNLESQIVVQRSIRLEAYQGPVPRVA